MRGGSNYRIREGDPSAPARKSPAEWSEHSRARRAVGFAEPLPTAWESWMRWLGLAPTPKHHQWQIRDEDYYRLHGLGTAER